MRFAAAIVLAAASAAVAQTTSAAAATPSDTGICAQNIVDVCVAQYDKQIKECEGNDWICLCDNYTNKLTCYNNCLGSEDRPPVQNQVTQYCNAAAPLISSSLASAATQSKSVSAAAATSTEATATATESNTASATAAEASGSSTPGAGAAVKVPVGGAVAVMLGLAGLL